MLADVADLGRDLMEVVEQPLCGSGDWLPVPDILGQGPIGIAQHVSVVGEAGKDVALEDDYGASGTRQGGGGGGASRPTADDDDVAIK